MIISSFEMKIKITLVVGKSLSSKISKTFFTTAIRFWHVSNSSFKATLEVYQRFILEVNSFNPIIKKLLLLTLMNFNFSTLTMKECIHTNPISDLLTVIISKVYFLCHNRVTVDNICNSTANVIDGKRLWPIVDKSENF